MLVTEILKQKGDLVFTVAPSESLSAAAALLHRHGVGALLVREGGDGEIRGILSERDIVWGLAKGGEGALNKTVADCMTREVIVASPSETVDSLMARMTDKRVRHLPVVKDGRLCGIVSIGDLVKHKIGEVEAEAANLKQYIATG
ncbi:MAG TPA: CBS domain-containing protein [Caulobacteraceae bacterium]|jgi:CBS domain-containing protein